MTYFNKILFTFFAILSFGQNNNSSSRPFTRCSTIEYEAELKAKNPSRQNINDFENILSPLVEKLKKDNANSKSINATPTTIYKIPVVIHIIHNGDAVGVEENISDAQAISQITVLNQDFRRLAGTPGFNNNPVGADMEIEFVLAKRKPDGTATNGIDRINTGVVQYTNGNSVEEMKKVTIWDSSKYMNIWTIRVGGGIPEWNGLLGYAQFPTNSGLIGVDNDFNPANSTEALTDGLVMRFDAFGSIDLAAGTYNDTYNKGRTATHEIGHWAGLRHIWGDGDCSVDDFCKDTPNARKENYNCPIGTDSCSDPGVDMIENYMDYTNDACMNIFTQDQKNRVHAVFLVADRRNSLLYSDALVPIGLSLDAGITLETDGINSCSLGLNPQVRLKNYGTTTITSAQITYSLDNVNLQTYNYSGNLTTGNSAVITLPNTLIFNSSEQNLFVNLNSVNGTDDNYDTNDASGKKVIKPIPLTGNTVTFNLQIDYDGSETTWDLKNNVGTIVYSGGPYADTPVPDPNNFPPLPPLISQTWNLNPNNCYTLTFRDTYGDGLKLGGYYDVKDQSGTTVLQGGGYKTTFSNSFIINALSNENFTINDITTSPNPNDGNFEISFQPQTNYVKIDIHDICGRLISEKMYNAGSIFKEVISIDNKQSGIYLVSIQDGNRKAVKKIIVQ